MIGLRTGLKTGVRAGIAVGVGADPISGGSTGPDVPQDATSGIYVPEDAADQLALGQPLLSSLYLMQEASGDLIDQIGGADLPANASPLYEQAMDGWARLAVEFDQTTGQRFFIASGGPDISAGSVLAYAVVDFKNNAGANRDVISFGSSPFFYVTNNSDQKIGVVSSGDSATSTGTYNGDPFPLVIAYNRTDSLVRIATNTEIISIPFTSIPGSVLCLGAYVGSEGPNAQISYLAISTGAPAELGTDASTTAAGIKAFLQRYGWTVTGY